MKITKKQLRESAKEEIRLYVRKILAENDWDDYDYEQEAEAESRGDEPTSAEVKRANKASENREAMLDALTQDLRDKHPELFMDETEEKTKEGGWNDVRFILSAMDLANPRFGPFTTKWYEDELEPYLWGSFSADELKLMQDALLEKLK